MNHVALANAIRLDRDRGRGSRTEANHNRPQKKTDERPDENSWNITSVFQGMHKFAGESAGNSSTRSERHRAAQRNASQQPPTEQGGADHAGDRTESGGNPKNVREHAGHQPTRATFDGSNYGDCCRSAKSANDATGDAQTSGHQDDSSNSIGALQRCHIVVSHPEDLKNDVAILRDSANVRRRHIRSEEIRRPRDWPDRH